MAKKLNVCCPLQTDCERKCTHEGHELDCDYYKNNARDDLVIADQEAIRERQIREREEQIYEESLNKVPDEEDIESTEESVVPQSGKNCHCQGCTNIYCTCAGMKKAPERMACDGYNNCSQSGCTFTIKHQDDDATVEQTTDEANSESIGNIVMIPIDVLHPHPDNPRKDLGDLTELAESIKVNGVLQNLTVVPYYSKVHYRVMDGLYTVIIGHRRLAAAKIAGLNKLPCVIVKLSKEEQLTTMLAENMQRSDLSLYEQAKSFQQLYIDFGKSVEEIAEMSGFSETTVRRRKKLADLDEKKFKKACDRGATLFDFAELDKIEDPAEKDECLSALGTANFKNTLATALGNQKARKRREKWLEQLPTFATKIETKDFVGEDYVHMVFFRNLGSWTKEDEIEKPSDADEVRYFYIVHNSQIDIYKEKFANEAEEAEAQRKEEIKAAQEAKYSQLCEISRRHFRLRLEFITNYGKAKSNASIISRNAMNAILHMTRSHGYCYHYNYCTLAELLSIPCDAKSNSIDQDAFRKRISEAPDFALLCSAYWLMDSERQAYVHQQWDSAAQMYMSRWQDNQTLDEVYYFLEELGYQTSDEERQMRRGTHPLFDPPASEV